LQRLKLQCGETLSNFAFNFNLRRYITGSVSGSLKVEGFSVDAFFLIDSATQSVKPTLRVKYEAGGIHITHSTVVESTKRVRASV